MRLFIAIFLLLFSFPSMQAQESKDPKKKQIVKTKKIDISGVKELYISGFSKVEIISSRNNTVEISYGESIENSIYSQISDNKATIGLRLPKKRTKEQRKASNAIQVYANFSFLKNIKLGEIKRLYADIHSDKKLSIEFYDCKSVKAKILADELNIQSEESRLGLKGRVKDLILNINSTKIQARKLKTKIVQLMAHQSDVDVSVSQSLQINKLEKTNLSYKGSCSIKMAEGISMRGSKIKSH